MHMKGTKKSAMPRTDLAVQRATDCDQLPDAAAVRAWVRAAYQGTGTAELTIRFVDEEEGRQLNSAYRGKDYATNVLSFPYSPPPSLAGDLVLCAPVVLREARDSGRETRAHFAHLIVHGMLHLQGFDHEDDLDAEAMEAQERVILASLGYPDPYE